MKVLFLILIFFGTASCREGEDLKEDVFDEAHLTEGRSKEVLATPKIEKVPELPPPDNVKVLTPPQDHHPVRKSRFTSTWDQEFKQWTKFYLPFHKYTMLKAQCYQESLLDPKAKSHVGAKGLCQFMDFTWKDVSGPLKFPPEASAYDPELSVQAAAFYDAKLRAGWKSPRPERDRMNLVFASYNAGMGHLIKAQEACDMKNLYNQIIECLPDITGHHSKETMTYVERIRKWEAQMNAEF